MTIALVAVIVWLGYRNWQFRRTGLRLIRAMERERPLLLEHGIRSKGRSIEDRLIQEVNEMINENARVSESEESYIDQIRKTLGNLREAVIITDEANAIQMANSAFRELVSATEQPIGKRLDSYIQGSTFQEYLRHVRQSESQERVELEVTVDHKTIWLEATGTQLGDPEEGKEPLFLFVFHNVTRQRKLERLRTEFVANVSHELKTPVTIIKGFADALVEDDAALSRKERLNFLRKIQGNAERLHRLLQDLLLLSRLESENAEMQMERISLRKLILETAENWSSVLNPKTQKLIENFDSKEDIVYVDSLRISQVVTNLLENVAKHAKGFTEVTLRTEVVQSGVNVHIADNGCGISEKHLPYIFQRFYRVERGRSREAGGTGLGLSIVKHIVQRHGGEISAKSEVDRGTEITFFIPFPEKMVEKAVFRSFREKRLKETNSNSSTPSRDD